MAVAVTTVGATGGLEQAPTMNQTFLSTLFSQTLNTEARIGQLTEKINIETRTIRNMSAMAIELDKLIRLFPAGSDKNMMFRDIPGWNNTDPKWRESERIFNSYMELVLGDGVTGLTFGNANGLGGTVWNVGTPRYDANGDPNFIKNDIFYYGECMNAGRTLGELESMLAKVNSTIQQKSNLKTADLVELEEVMKLYSQITELLASIIEQLGKKNNDIISRMS